MLVVLFRRKLGIIILMDNILICNGSFLYFIKMKNFNILFMVEIKYVMVNMKNSGFLV